MFQRCTGKGIGGRALQISSNSQIVSIVDDELDITELLREAICDSIVGISVVTCNDPTDALEHFANNKKDYVLVISDLRMPSLTGLELLKRIKGSSPNVRTILMSHLILNLMNYIELIQMRALYSRRLKNPYYCCFMSTNKR